jgi:hypothetical protein
MVCFQTKNPNLGKFWGFLQWKIFVYFMTIWSILRTLEIFYGHLVHFVVIWYISPRFGILYQEISDNPGPDMKTHTNKFFFKYVGLAYQSRVLKNKYLVKVSFLIFRIKVNHSIIHIEIDPTVS